MNEAPQYSIDDEGYFGISLLDMGAYGAHLMNNRVLTTQDNGIKLYFEDAGSTYLHDKRALTIEGNAGPLSTSGFALKSLEAYAKVAREMDELAKPFAS